MNEKLSAITQLVNDVYAEDCTWYDCEVFDEDKCVVMVDFWNSRAYRQSYKVKEGVYSLRVIEFLYIVCGLQMTSRKLLIR